MVAVTEKEKEAVTSFWENPHLPDSITLGIPIGVTVVKVDITGVEPNKIIPLSSDQARNRATITYDILPSGIVSSSILPDEVVLRILDSDAKVVYETSGSYHDSHEVVWDGSITIDGSTSAKADIMKNRYGIEVELFSNGQSIGRGVSEGNEEKVTLVPFIESIFLHFDTGIEDESIGDNRNAARYPYEGQEVTFWIVAECTDVSLETGKQYFLTEDGTPDEIVRVMGLGGAPTETVESEMWREEWWGLPEFLWRRSKGDFEEEEPGAVYISGYSMEPPSPEAARSSVNLEWPTAKETRSLMLEGSYLFKAKMKFDSETSLGQEFPEGIVSKNFDPESSGRWIFPAMRVSYRSHYEMCPHGFKIGTWASTYLNVNFENGGHDYDFIDCKGVLIKAASASRGGTTIQDTTADGLCRNYYVNSWGIPIYHEYTEDIEMTGNGPYDITDLISLPAGTLLFYDWDNPPGTPGIKYWDYMDHSGLVAGQTNPLIWASYSTTHVVKRMWGEILEDPTSAIYTMYSELDDVKIFVENP